MHGKCCTTAVHWLYEHHSSSVLPHPLLLPHPAAPASLAAFAAGSEAALASAVRQALKLHPRCLEFFVDRCDRFDAPAFVREAAGKPDTLAGLGTPSSYMVCAKRLPVGGEGAQPASPRSRV